MRVMLIKIFLLMCKHVMMRCLIWSMEQHLLVLRRLFLIEAQSPSLIANSKYKGALQSSSYSAGGILFLFFPKQNKKANHVDYVPNVFITPHPQQVQIRNFTKLNLTTLCLVFREVVFRHHSLEILTQPRTLLSQNLFQVYCKYNQESGFLSLLSPC